MQLINGKEYPDSLRGADLRNANLQRANLRRADLRGANLQGADLQSANLHGANLRGANLRGTNLRGANLYGTNLTLANLSRANLCRVNLHDTTGNGREIISLQTTWYTITYTATHMQIGCQYHSITEWMAFEDDTIETMDFGAVDWWTHHKRWIQDAIEMNPASSTLVPSRSIDSPVKASETIAHSL
jgi:uncharacterized protein YjbI with pentapeptide repeats